MAVKDGRIVLPDGMSYRLLALPDSQTMTPRLLAKVVELVEAGATVVGRRPQKSPGLEEFPACDAEVKKLADRLWGDCDGQKVKQHALGKGRVVWGQTPEQVLAAMKLPVDFACDGGLAGNLRYIHRTLEDGADLYFVGNKREAGVSGTCSFRVAGKRPELWWPESGRTELAAAWQEKDGVTRLPLYLEPAESVFVVFRPSPGGFDPVVAMTCDGKPMGPALHTRSKFVVTKAVYGVPGDAQRTRNVTDKVRKLLDAGKTSFVVSEMAAGDDPAYMVVKTLEVDYTVDGKPCHARGQDPEEIELLPELANAPRLATLTVTDGNGLQLEAWRDGRFECTTASGHRLAATVQGLPRAETVAGPWQVKFPASGAAPHAIVLDSLAAWNVQADEAVKYFSGTAVYSKVIAIPGELLGKGCGLYLDLGRVAVMARVKLNGHDLGVLWKAPYRVEIGQFAKAGDNTLEIEVTNLWINRMIGDENLPDDSDRNGDGTLKSWPKWVLDGKSSPKGRQTFTSWRLYRRAAPLVESGLLGPVTLRATQRTGLTQE